jgi:ubiquinone/menaquinone biosynthesis C-methylase UbiE
MCKYADRPLAGHGNKALLSDPDYGYGVGVKFVRTESSRAFPRPDRAVPSTSGTEFSTEAARDEAGEAKKLMDWAAIEPGTTVADIGAGEGYYTVRLSARVGLKGRVLAQDINRGALDRLAERVVRERLLDNVAIQEGGLDDPRLPPGSFDRIFMVHMYHEITEPYAFLWRMRPALAKGGQVIVVDRDLPTAKHGIPPKLLFCEFAAVGYRLKEFEERQEVGAYFARFELMGERPRPEAIKACKASAVVPD